ncbi:MAG: 3'-5' exoribonuclease YhaM family protein [Planctomycetota bacterium]|jgi:3'-5' exoribonuclease
MARRYIAELTPGERIEDQVFLIASKDLRQTTQGSLYIHAVLVDRTGQVPARLWQASESIFAGIPEGGFVRLKGRTENYKGSLQFIIEGVRPVEDSAAVDLGEFLPRTEGDIDAMWARLQEIVGGIRNEFVAELIRQFLADEELVRRFKTAPAAAQLHHAYIGGLLEHTLAVLETALLVIPRYPKVSLDLVLAGIFLHDIAKTAELTYETNFGYTDSGQLVGHVVTGTIWIEHKAAAAAKALGKPFPGRIKWVLQHIVLSHHGQYEFGSPKLPAVPEAIAIHHLDNLDAKLNQFLGKIENDKDPESDWTKYIPAIASKVYKPDVLDDRLK